METNETLKLSPDQFTALILSGQMQPVESQGEVKNHLVRTDNQAIEVARSMFQENFIGADAIKGMEEQCKTAGLDIQFLIPNIQFPYSEDNLLNAKKDSRQRKSRMIVLRPSEMIVQGEIMPITIKNLISLFKSNNPFGTGKLFNSENGKNRRKYLITPLKARYSIPTKEICPNSCNRSWDDQDLLRNNLEGRREAIETVWDILLYYSATGEKLLYSSWDWTKSYVRAINTSESYVCVGEFDDSGINIFEMNPYVSTLDKVGACFTF